MKAVRIHSYGSSSQLRIEDMERPEPRAGEALVHICYAGVNPVDWKIREGALKEVRPMKFPLTMGQDFSGEVMETSRETREVVPGDKVFGFANGSYREYAAVPVHSLARMPLSIGLEQAAGLPTPGLTAWQIMMGVVNAAPGQRILIHGAGGAVGSLAVQLGRWKGASLCATASRDDADYLKGLNVSPVIDYRTQKFEEELRDLDAVVDLVGGNTLDRSYAVLKRGGVLVTTVGPIDEPQARSLGIRAASFLMKQDGAQLAELAKLVDQGILTPRVSRVLPLREAQKAQDLVQKGHPHGKVILEIH